jgi:single-stranded DNA-binding protein
MSATEIKTQIETTATGRITRAPEMATTTGGVPVCRFTLVTETGCASNPVVRTIWVVGGSEERFSEKLAVRVASKLRVGDLVVVPGVERNKKRCRRGVSYYDSWIEAQDVRLPRRGNEARA